MSDAGLLYCGIDEAMNDPYVIITLGGFLYCVGGPVREEDTPPGVFLIPNGDDVAYASNDPTALHRVPFFHPDWEIVKLSLAVDTIKRLKPGGCNGL